MVRDAALPVYEQFARATLTRLREGDMQHMVEVHRRAPFGPHPDDLARVLNVFRAADTAGKHLIVALPGVSGYRLATITGRREEGSIELQPEIYPTVEEAEHAIFLARLTKCGLAGAPEVSA